MKTLAYWKSSLQQAKSAFKAHPCRELSQAVRFAQRKVRQIERKVLVHIVCIALCCVLSGCNTLSGIGKDIQGLAEYRQQKPQQQTFEQWKRSQLK